MKKTFTLKAIFSLIAISTLAACGQVVPPTNNTNQANTVTSTPTNGGNNTSQYSGCLTQTYYFAYSNATYSNGLVVIGLVPNHDANLAPAGQYGTVAQSSSSISGSSVINTQTQNGNLAVSVQSSYNMSGMMALQLSSGIAQGIVNTIGDSAACISEISVIANGQSAALFIKTNSNQWVGPIYF